MLLSVSTCGCPSGVFVAHTHRQTSGVLPQIEACAHCTLWQAFRHSTGHLFGGVRFCLWLSFVTGFLLTFLLDGSTSQQVV